MAALFFLVGPPAVGKLTIARELEKRGDVIVVDNHLISDAVFVPMGFQRGDNLDATDDLRDRVRDVVLEAAARAPGHVSHVWTNWLLDGDVDRQYVADLRELAQKRGVRFVPVWLTASAAELERRVVQESRLERRKLRDADILRELLARPTLPAPKDALCLDITQLSPAEAANAIWQFAHG